MLSAEIVSALIKWSQWIKPGLHRLYYFIVGALDGKESSHEEGKERGHVLQPYSKTGNIIFI